MKANPKMKADPKADAALPAPASSKKKLLLIVLGAIVLLGAGLGGGWYLNHATAGNGNGNATAQQAQEPEPEVRKKKKRNPAVKPEYIPLDAFTVNLQPENGEQYLQVQFTLQVSGPEYSQEIKDNMAIVRNRVLLLLSSKRASEISTVEGKQQLAAEIQAAINEPFEWRGGEQDVTDVLFTSFIIQ